MAHLPVQVFTELKNTKVSNRSSDRTPVNMELEKNIKLSEKNIQEAALLSTMSRQITVSGVGELDLPPDLFSLTIRCKAIKENIQAAKASVTRRVDYVIQTLKNHALKEDDFKVYTHASHQDSQAQYESEIEAQFTSIEKCLKVSNLLAEKLGPGVNISHPVCYHAQGSLDKLRKQVGMLAIYNARQKALEMAKILQLSVGQAMRIDEEGTVETYGSTTSEAETFETNPSTQQKIAEKTVRICNRVNVCFQLKSGKPRRL